MSIKDFEEYIQGNKNLVFSYSYINNAVEVEVIISATYYSMCYPFDYILIVNSNYNTRWELPTDTVCRIGIIAQQ